MKLFLPVIAILLGSLKSTGQGLIFNENFTGYTDGNIGGQGNWTVSNNNTQPQVANVSPYLAYTGYTSGSHYLNVYPSSSARYAWKDFITPMPLNTSSVLYMSFVFRINSGTDNDAERIVALRDDDGDDLLRFYVDRDNSGAWRFGLGAQNEGATYTGYDYTYNTNYLIVIRYDAFTGSSTNDDIYMWVNPSLSAEPSTSATQLTNSNITEAYSTADQLEEIEISLRSNTPTASLDAFKISYGSGNGSTAANAAAAWSDLAPAGIALPVTFGDIRGQIKSNAVQVDWTIFSEVNVSRYEVQRSTDGRQFTTVGSVAAARIPKYTFTDNNPASGANYYRVKNIDIDGSSSYSQVVKVVLGKAVADLTLFPNPTKGDFISLLTPELAKGSYSIRVFNYQGAQVYRNLLNHDGGSLSNTLRLPAGLKAGMYMLEISNGEERVMKQFVISE